MTAYAAQMQQLTSAYENQRLSHAYLLSGIPGLGKTDFALAFAQKVLGSDPHQHPDFIFIQPEEKSHSIKIDQIRALTDVLSRTAHRGSYQVALISPADAMPTGAANALLKTLEEPQGNVLILLVDNQTHSLPKTILSRCQKIAFYPDHAFTGIDKKLFEAVFAHLQAIISKQMADPIAPVVAWAKEDLMQVLNAILAAGIHLSQQYYKAQPIGISIDGLHQFLQLVCEKKRLVSQGVNLNAQLCLENVFIVLTQCQ